MGNTGYCQKKKKKQAAMSKFGIFLSIAQPKKHFLIETNNDAGSDDYGSDYQEINVHGCNGNVGNNCNVGESHGEGLILSKNGILGGGSAGGSAGGSDYQWFDFSAPGK